MADLAEIFLASIVSSGFVFFLAKQLILNSLEMKLENHKQDLNKKLQRFSLYEQKKHEVYQTYFEILMKSQSVVRLKIGNQTNEDHISSMATNLNELNNYIFSNYLYFSNEIYNEAELLLDLIRKVAINKETLLKQSPRTPAYEKFVKANDHNIKEIEKKLGAIKENMKKELTGE